MGTNYWENPQNVLSVCVIQRGGTSTGWAEIDKKLYGGFNRGELNIFAAASVAVKVCFCKTWD